MPHRVHHRRGLKTTMHHACFTPLVSVGTIPGPIRGRHQFLKSFSISVIYQVAGPLPAKNIVGRIAPGRTSIVLSTREKIQIEFTVIENPLAHFTQLEQLSEELDGILTSRELALHRGLFVSKSRSDGHTLNTQSADKIQKAGRIFRCFTIIESSIGSHSESGGLEHTNCCHRLIKNTLSAHKTIMPLAQAIQVNAERQVMGRFEIMNPFADQYCIGAKIDKFFSIDQLPGYNMNVGVQQRFAASDGDDRRTTRFSCRDAITHTDLFR